jgi:23S rRNA (cytosine1962-C5)-methyltransferase
MESLPTVLLRPGEADRPLAGHPWIYHGSLLRTAADIDDGAVVQVKDHRQRLIGVGFWNSKSKIRVRLLSRERIQIGPEFFRERIREAHALRQKHLPHATSFRLVNSESDLLSGLIIDRYEDVLVIQLSSLGMDRRKAQIVQVLQELFAPRAIIERSDVASRKFEGLEESNAILSGQLDGPVPVRLNGITFETDLSTGHKTGMYLDQQVNYRLVAQLLTNSARFNSGPPQVLDCFSFAGGFALHCAAALARPTGRDVPHSVESRAASVEGSRPSTLDPRPNFHIHAIDQSEQAVAQAQHNAAVNNLSEVCTFEAANVFDWLKAQTTTRPHEKIIPRYDLIILDPPSFTRNRASVPDALRGYKEIHLRALKLLRPGGTLATYCCSHHVDAELFQQVILAAAYDAHRILRRVATYTQSPDHPVLPSIPETEYLKGFAFEIVPNY